MSIELKRKLFFLEGMANVLVKQVEDIQKELLDLENYSHEDLESNIDKLKEIDDKLYSVGRILRGEEVK